MIGLAAIAAIASAAFVMLRKPPPALDPKTLSAFDTPAPDGMVDLIFGDGYATMRLPVDAVATSSRLTSAALRKGAVLIGISQDAIFLANAHNLPGYGKDDTISVFLSFRTLPEKNSDTRQTKAWEKEQEFTSELVRILPDDVLRTEKFGVIDKALHDYRGDPIRFQCNRGHTFPPPGGSTAACSVVFCLAHLLCADWKLFLPNGRRVDELPEITLASIKAIVPYLRGKVQLKNHNQSRGN